MTDTRDIAIRADERGKSAHNRLDTINGQIRRLGDSHEKMRQDFSAANAQFVDDFGNAYVDLVKQITEIGTTVRNALRVAGLLCLLVISITSGITVYVLTHAHHASPPSQAAPQGK